MSISMHAANEASKDQTKRGGKRILKEVLARYVPRALTDRPKRGFGVPVGDWLRGALRPWAEDPLSESRLRGEGLLDPPAVRRLWDQHLTRWRNHTNVLWAILIFQAWKSHEQASDASPVEAGARSAVPATEVARLSRA